LFVCIAPQVIMSLVQKHGKEHISIASFGLTAVSNLIHTDSSKDKFGSLGEYGLRLMLDGLPHLLWP
jgi:hypothetical protein